MNYLYAEGNQIQFRLEFWSQAPLSELTKLPKVPFIEKGKG